MIAATALLCATTLAACGRTGEAATPPAHAAADTSTWCDQPSVQGLCASVPHEVMFPLLAGYTSKLLPNIQPTFDDFSWRSFIALNWPATPPNAPIQVGMEANPRGPRVWEQYADAADVFGGSGAGSCGAGGKLLVQMAKNGHVVDPNGDFDEAVGGPLVDRNLNFVVYEKRMNPEEVGYVRRNGLTTVAGQEAAASITFPMGSYADTARRVGGPVGAMEVKAAWRILQPERGDDTTRFYTRHASVFVPARNSATGRPLCLSAVVGLVGLHIIHKTGRFKEWVWSTFEHVDNAPDCSFGTGGCGADGRRYSFFNAACGTLCAVNDSVHLGSTRDSTFLWAPRPPYATRYAVNTPRGRYGAQITRTQALYPPTDSVNAVWRRRVPGVWKNYRLIGSQWHLNGDSPTPVPAAPDTLRNTALESFIPHGSSCVGCHKFATTAHDSTHAAKSADFSFLLSMAGKPHTMIAPPAPLRRRATGTR